MDSRHQAEVNKEKQDRHLADLLGITYEEYLPLRHGGLEEITDSEEHIYRYCIRFASDNPVQVLDKLDMDGNNTVYFTYEEVHRETGS
jgi:hypothetical protein